MPSGQEWGRGCKDRDNRSWDKERGLHHKVGEGAEAARTGARTGTTAQGRGTEVYRGPERQVQVVITRSLQTLSYIIRDGVTFAGTGVETRTTVPETGTEVYGPETGAKLS